MPHFLLDNPPELVTSSVDDSTENSSTSSVDSSSLGAGGSLFARHLGRHRHEHRHPFRQSRYDSQLPT